MEHDPYLRTSYQNEELSKQKNCNIKFSLRPKAALL